MNYYGLPSPEEVKARDRAEAKRVAEHLLEEGYWSGSPHTEHRVLSVYASPTMVKYVKEAMRKIEQSGYTSPQTKALLEELEGANTEIERLRGVIKTKEQLIDNWVDHCGLLEKQIQKLEDIVEENNVRYKELQERYESYLRVKVETGQLR